MKTTLDSGSRACWWSAPGQPTTWRRSALRSLRHCGFKLVLRALLGALLGALRNLGYASQLRQGETGLSLGAAPARATRSTCSNGMASVPRRPTLTPRPWIPTRWRGVPLGSLSPCAAVTATCDGCEAGAAPPPARRRPRPPPTLLAGSLRQAGARFRVGFVLLQSTQGRSPNADVGGSGWIQLAAGFQLVFLSWDSCVPHLVFKMAA